MHRVPDPVLTDFEKTSYEELINFLFLRALQPGARASGTRVALRLLTAAAAIAEGDDQSAKKKAAPGAAPASGDALLADNPDDPPEVREAKRKGRLQKEAQKVAPSGHACMRALSQHPADCAWVAARRESASHSAA